MSNKSMGTQFEQDFCEILFNNGFWAHNAAQKVEGQPSDVIAVKGDRAFLIDCKVCSRDKFPLSRIEENQKLSMSLWEKRSDFYAWFALKTSDDIYMVSFARMKELEDTAHRSITGSHFLLYGYPLKEWLRLMERVLK